jgi:hypothetical protein
MNEQNDKQQQQLSLVLEEDFYFTCSRHDIAAKLLC